ncbi:CRISPR associated Cas2 family protein, partial [Escherichia coli P0304816.10]
MYAISFDLSVAALDQHYPGNNYNNAYAEIRRFLEAKGFNRQQGSVYFGD